MSYDLTDIVGKLKLLIGLKSIPDPDQCFEERLIFFILFVKCHIVVRNKFLTQFGGNGTVEVQVAVQPVGAVCVIVVWFPAVQKETVTFAKIIFFPLIFQYAAAFISIEDLIRIIIFSPGVIGSPAVTDAEYLGIEIMFFIFFAYGKRK